SMLKGTIKYGPLYYYSKSIEQNEPLQRLSSMFEEYRSVLYAVFRTTVLQQAYQGAGGNVKNLFLNEYVSAFIPILYGKCKELPILYQVREHALDSDDKITKDLDALLSEKQYENDLDIFKGFIAKKIADILRVSYTEAKDV